MRSTDAGGKSGLKESQNAAQRMNRGATVSLFAVQELLEAEGKLKEAVGRLESLQRDDARNKESREKWTKLSRELEIKVHQTGLLEEQVGGSNATRVCHFVSYSLLIRLTYLRIQIGG